MSSGAHYDLVVVGAGPAGQKAAIQAAKAGRNVAVVEQQSQVGGDCVHRGTVPSKALRETALQISRARRTVADVRLPPTTPLTALLGRVGEIIDRNVEVQRDQLSRNGVSLYTGRATFTSPTTLSVQPVRGQAFPLTADVFVIATGSVPRSPSECPVDHADVLDSDSILSLPYLPRSLAVLGGGVIACEYASTFLELGVEVTVIDRAPRPLSFMDGELIEALLKAWSNAGCAYLPNRGVTRIAPFQGGSALTLSSGTSVFAEKVLVGLGRVANVARLGLAAAGVVVSPRGHIAVDANFRTSVPHIYAVGDVIGFPALAATSMEQGRRAARHALGLSLPAELPVLPVGIYTIPELGQVGLTEEQALEKYGAVRVGRCRYDEVARGQISGERDGLLKLVTDADGERLLGVAAAGADANDLVHVGQIAMLGGLGASTFVDAVMNFPTWGEAYRIAALALQRADAVRSVARVAADATATSAA